MYVETISYFAKGAGDYLPFLHDKDILARLRAERLAASLIVDCRHFHGQVKVLLTQVAGLQCIQIYFQVKKKI